MLHVNTNLDMPTAGVRVTHRFFPVGMFRAGNLCPMIRLSETSEAYTLILLAAGLRKDLIRAQIDGSILTITLETTPEAPGLPCTGELGSDTFTRSFQLPDHICASELEGTYTDGALQLILPKAEGGLTTRKRAIPIR